MRKLARCPGPPARVKDITRRQAQAGAFTHCPGASVISLTARIPLLSRAVSLSALQGERAGVRWATTSPRIFPQPHAPAYEGLDTLQGLAAWLELAMQIHLLKLLDLCWTAPVTPKRNG